jgi:deoxyribonuclease IV
MLIIGAHTIDKGGIDMAVRRAAAAGMSAVQIFTAIPKFYGDRSSIRPERVERFRQALHDTGIAAENVLVHAAYVLSVATPDREKGLRATAGLAREMERSSILGAGAVCFHPGSATDGDVEAACKRVAAAMTTALQAADGPTRLLIENTAGAGRTIGRHPEEIAAILSWIPPALRHRTGFGLDTCHLFAAGYDIADSPQSLGQVVDAFQTAAGQPPAFFHLNDSEGELGSNRDRHRLIGEGNIGEQPFRWLLADSRSRGVPLILETPQAHEDIADDSAEADPWDLRMRRLLEQLASG